jgi:hypothetical protein
MGRVPPTRLLRVFLPQRSIAAAPSGQGRLARPGPASKTN